MNRVHTGHFKQPATANAIAFREAYFDEVTEEDFDHNLKTNAIGPYWLTFAFLPLLEKWKESPGAGRFAPQIVMTSSMNGWTKVSTLSCRFQTHPDRDASCVKDPATSGNTFPYMYSKSAIGHATASLAHELLPLGVRVNGIAPGLFITEMSAPGTMNEFGQSRVPKGRAFAFEVPVSRPAADGQPRAGTNKDMGALVLFLVANWFVDGETVLIDGGVSVIFLCLRPLWWEADRSAIDLVEASVLVLMLRQGFTFSIRQDCYVRVTYQIIEK